MSDELSSFEQLPHDALYEIAQRMSFNQLMKMCASSTTLRGFCKENPQLLEKKARKELLEINPHLLISGSPLQLLMLIKLGQITWYEADVVNGTTRPMKSLNNINDGGDHVIFSLPGTLVKRGRYWLVGTPEEWGFPYRLITTEEEMRDFFQEVRAENYYDITRLVAEYEQHGGINGTRAIDRRLGDDNQDQVLIYLVPTQFE